MTFLVIVISVIGFIWLASKLKAWLLEAAHFNSQVIFLQEYLQYSKDPAVEWITRCINKEELLTIGQDKLWQVARKFHSNLERFAKNDFKVQPGDVEMMKQMLEIVSTVHFMYAAEKGDVKFVGAADGKLL